MSVKQLESAVVALTAQQKAELLQRKGLFPANPSLAEPWAGTLEKILQHLSGRHTLKASSRCR